MAPVPPKADLNKQISASSNNHWGWKHRCIQAFQQRASDTLNSKLDIAWRDGIVHCSSFKAAAVGAAWDYSICISMRRTGMHWMVWWVEILREAMGMDRNRNDINQEDGKGIGKAEGGKKVGERMESGGKWNKEVLNKSVLLELAARNGVESREEEMGARSLRC